MIVDLTKALPPVLEIERDDGMVVSLSLMYPWLPPLCPICNEIGHNAPLCLKASPKSVSRKSSSKDRPKDSSMRHQSSSKSTKEPLMKSAKAPITSIPKAIYVAKPPAGSPPVDHSPPQTAYQDPPIHVQGLDPHRKAMLSEEEDHETLQTNVQVHETVGTIESKAKDKDIISHVQKEAEFSPASNIVRAKFVQPNG